MHNFHLLPVQREPWGQACYLCSLLVSHWLLSIRDQLSLVVFYLWKSLPSLEIQTTHPWTMLVELSVLKHRMYLTERNIRKTALLCKSYLFTNSSKRMRWEYPFWRILTVSRIPVYRSCSRTLSWENISASRSSLGLMQRIKWGCPTTILDKRSMREY